MTSPSSIYRCSRCGEEHEELEPGFRRPDALFAVPQEERETRVREDNDLCVVDGKAHFIRAVAPLHVQGRDETFQWGLWAQVTKEDFEDYLRLWDVAPPAGHPGYEARVANQCALVPPLLGTPVHVTLGPLGKRPYLRFTDERHLLGRFQRDGIGLEQVTEWSSRTMHPHDPEPAGERFAASLQEHGWAVLRPEEIGEPAHVFERPPGERDCVKAPFRFLASGPAGEVTTRVELMWVQLDSPAEGQWLTGALANHPAVPGPLDAGTRVFLESSHCLAHDPAPAP